MNWSALDFPDHSLEITTLVEADQSFMLRPNTVQGGIENWAIGNCRSKRCYIFLEVVVNVFKIL